MAAQTDDLELEGDVEGDVDLSDWATPVSDSGNPKSGRRNHRTQHKTPYKSSSNKDRADKAKPRHVQSRSSNLVTKSTYTKLDTSKKNSDNASSDVGDIAGFIGSIDSSRKKTNEVLPKTPKQTVDKKPDSGVRTPPRSADLLAARKRKQAIDASLDSSKPKKINNENGNKYEPVKPVDDAEVKQEDEKDVKKPMPCSEEECRNIDTDLVEEMMKSVKKEIMPRNAEYTVRFSPVELADLAEDSVQKLVLSQPSLAFYFKRQGKFKKKKGYAEVYLTQMQDARLFIQKLVQIQLIEQNMEVTLTVSRPNKRDEVLSLIISLSYTGPLQKVVKNTADATKVLHGVKKEPAKVEKVPAATNALLLRAVFPFAAEVIFSPDQKKVQSGYKGPVNIYYASKSLKEAVLDCCSGFTYNGFPILTDYTQKAQVTKTKQAAEVKKEGGAVPERRNSAQEKAKTGKDGNNSSGSIKSIILTPPQDATLDADISNMTLDVCAGMLESLNKLRQLGTDNPNIIKILQMQNELATLHQSLAQPKDQSPADPWTVSATEDLDDTQDDGQEEQDKKISKEPKKKQETRAEKQKKEMEDLQRMIEEAEEENLQREERSKKQIEGEKQKLKELEEKRKANWARRVIEDAKQSAPLGENTSSKEEAQRLLKIVGNKRKDAEEAKRLEELAKAVEKERLQLVGDDKMSCEDVVNSTVEQDEPGTVIQDDAGSSVEEQPDITDDDVATWSPNRDMHEGAPVYSEQEFAKMTSDSAVGVVPWNHYVRILYHSNRGCPVQSCSSSKYFKTASCFDVHWDVFHKPNVKVKFCQKCNAYFTNVPELESHLTNRHSITDQETVKTMSEEAREKVVTNPSYRDPGVYLPPVVQ
jgi:hypothetical protein